jgi:methionyl-tRNA formyltransferase
MDPLRIVFMGSPDFAVPSLEKLHDSPHEIVVVASNPDKRRGRRSKPTPTAVKQKALDLIQQAHEALANIEADTTLLASLANYLIERDH